MVEASTAQHTPEPWILEADHLAVTARLENRAVVDIAHTNPFGEIRPIEAIANARLIAAAPELLEALQAFMSNRSVVAGLPMTAAKARAAISKATGAA